MSLQPYDELDHWHKAADPWEYESSKDDLARKSILLGELPRRKYRRVLDIGCGQGFITRDLPGKSVLGVDVSGEAIKHAKKHENSRIIFKKASIFDLRDVLSERFDLIVITGVLYQQYVGNSLNLLYLTVDDLLEVGGILVSVHINSWYRARFPYLLAKEFSYDYRNYVHKLEIYLK